MIDCGIQNVFKVLRVKHLFLILLAVTFALLMINSVNFSLVPLWALHLNPNEAAHGDQLVLWSLANPIHSVPVQTDSHIASALVVLRGERDRNFSSVVVYGLPTFDSLLLSPNHKPKPQTGRKTSLLHKITPIAHFQLPDGDVLAVSAFFWNTSLIVATVYARESIGSHTTAHSYVLSVWDQQTESTVWERVLAPVPSRSMQAKTKTNASPVLLTSSICVIVGETHCGVIFVLLPTETSDANCHFSTLALSVKTGQILWHHLPGDFDEDRAQKLNTNALPHWKLRLLAQHEAHLHIGESPWSVYRDAIVKALPLYWYGSMNSRIQLVHRSSHTVPVQPGGHVDSTSRINAVLVTHPLGVDLLDIVSGRPLARLPLEWQSGSTYANMPSMNESGLFSHTLTDQSIQQIRVTSKIIPTGMSGRAVHVRRDAAAATDRPDVFRPDPVEFGQGDFSHQVDCRGLVDRMESDASVAGPLVTTGHTVLYAGLCRPSGWLDYARFGRPDWLEDETKSVPPLIVKHSGSRGLIRSLWNSIRPRLRDASLPESNSHAHHREDLDRHDIIFLTSDGSLTSVSNRGHENWHINAEVSWLQISRTVSAGLSQSGSESSLDPQLHQLYTEHFRPALWSAELVPLNQDFSWHSALFGPQLRWIPRTKHTGFGRATPHLTALTVVVATGWDSVSVVDPSTGNLLATHRLPCRPSDQPSLVRLPYSKSNKEFLVDSVILVPCDGMLLAFGLTSELRLLALLLTVLSLCGSFVVLHFCCQLPVAGDE